MANICPKCGDRLIAASGNVEYIMPDQEPYEDGVVEEAEGVEDGEIYPDDMICISVSYCRKCDEVKHARLKDFDKDGNLKNSS